MGRGLVGDYAKIIQRLFAVAKAARAFPINPER